MIAAEDRSSMDEHCEVSVVVPAYNASRTIRETLHSVQQQTLRNIEIIVVDDGSTDDTADIVRTFQLHDSRIRIIQTENRGISSARNTGIQAASAAIVAPTDADDLWHPEKLKMQLEVLRRDPDVALVYTNWRRIDLEGLVQESPQPWNLEGWVYLRHVAHNFIGNGSALMFRREAALLVGGYDPSVISTEDIHFQLKMARQFKFGVAPGYLVGYRKVPGSVSSDDAKMLYARIRVMEFIEGLGEREARTVAREAKAVLRFRLFGIYAKRGRLGQAGRLLAEAIAAPPMSGRRQILAYLWSRLERRSQRQRFGGGDPSLGRRYPDLDPFAASKTRRSRYIERRVASLTGKDEAYRPRTGR
jgi:GT2 family glycosyltransferase